MPGPPPKRGAPWVVGVDETTVAEAIEAAAREVAARRARLPETWVHRTEKAELAVEFWALIDQWLDVTTWPDSP